MSIPSNDQDRSLNRVKEFFNAFREVSSVVGLEMQIETLGGAVIRATKPGVNRKGRRQRGAHPRSAVTDVRLGGQSASQLDVGRGGGGRSLKVPLRRRMSGGEQMASFTQGGNEDRQEKKRREQRKGGAPPYPPPPPFHSHLPTHPLLGLERAPHMAPAAQLLAVT